MERKIILINGNYHDITDYQHPGGDDVLLQYINKRDATIAFNDAGHSQEAIKILDNLPKIVYKNHKNFFIKVTIIILILIVIDIIQLFYF